MKQLVVSVALVLVSNCAPALGADGAAASDVPGESVANSIETALLRSTYAMTFVVQAYDARTTLDAVHAGAREVDPLIRPFASDSTALVAANLARAATVDV